MSFTPEVQPDGTLILSQPVRLPGVLDLLVVGGGPAGTAAAFRARELGLAVLVIDFDDLMKRIRDYAKDKLILPDYGGGDQMPFPRGGALINALHFTPIDKDEMCRRWKSYYRTFNVPAQIGVELTGLQRNSDGTWLARAYNHRTKAEQFYTARHVALTIGRGVPRRFDIPGNTEGIAYRLSDAAQYVGEPVCVIGGGTSAAEAVIAISNAKARANDATAVYWSCRSDKLPKVSRALAEVFFEAFMTNGNIRQFPGSEPVAVLTAEDRREYLSVRIDRRRVPGRPGETVHLEFVKEFCVACIGEDIPEAFLSSLGIDMVAGGPQGKKRFVVNPLLETRQPNVYLLGDILSPAYFETEDFNADPASFREIKRRGNIKAALRDGVLVAEAVAQKLAGQTSIRIDLDFEEAPRTAAPPPRRAGTVVVESEGPAQADLPQTNAATAHTACLVRLLAGNVEADEFPLREDRLTTIGRAGCDLSFPEDVLLSEKHASILYDRSEGCYLLRDDGSVNGVFVRLQPASAREVMPGSLVRVGRQFLLFGRENGAPLFVHFDAEGKPLGRHPLTERTQVLGREAPDVTLDPKDLTLSRRHLAVRLEGGVMKIKDLGSANGTFLKIKGAMPLRDGDQFRVGQQLFLLQLRTLAPRRTVLFNTRPGVASPPVEAATPAPAPARSATPVSQRAATPLPQGLLVRFKNANKTVPFRPGQSICEIAEKHGLALKADCRIGSCGMDPIRILAGRENLNEIGDEERGTLEDINKLQAGEYRLACMARPIGPVTVEILKK
ncbi:MAG: FHA domain-containing protein [candidate division KSB1 bacterium]|nr:FHA domain-containing protein [candidate division KSB1 bacterium]MDZ7275516.1 FHA domain-containing protein [candidate division KSB1 bacterium]MDZ7286172.1 FHA domain-containing protein [candidate division KSB1 bacterium]MDZ7296398.1 FHA domain-containing protein [candidate division KSB1 bacterium]MDZ7306233.1 FHA domain-containing protein [candidate division KSB1 bacterium]